MDDPVLTLLTQAAATARAGDDTGADRLVATALDRARQARRARFTSDHLAALFQAGGGAHLDAFLAARGLPTVQIGPARAMLFDMLEAHQVRACLERHGETFLRAACTAGWNPALHARTLHQAIAAQAQIEEASAWRLWAELCRTFDTDETPPSRHFHTLAQALTEPAPTPGLACSIAARLEALADPEQIRSDLLFCLEGSLSSPKLLALLAWLALHTPGTHLPACRGGDWQTECVLRLLASAHGRLHFLQTTGSLADIVGMAGDDPRLASLVTPP